ncbi:methyl-accepting chemotaxis protein [Rhodoblastus acidophilus]|uniref:methyl-accepting chemotaxis protein n=1 Tax=Rhodoblastus acidophilus TaxID=1074 RepID=UPI0022251AF4|nr:Cache 3/Cache 2 fusion domain-containing protein [Rhodoblastus acidophilus]MCW2284673.1 methyl-accepting chemotaxis protein [Rhodoblastus acidophilus]MCW2333626.1 methyl-accepting chemotaxis protein [Rhodoblastus acidophilus]
MTLPKLHLRGKALALFVPGLVLVAAAVTASVMWLASESLDAKLNEDLKLQARVIATAFADVDTHETVEITDGVVRKVQTQRIPEFNGHDVVDKVSTVTGGVATVFLWDEAQGDFVRRTTSITNEKGERAIGTTLGKDHPAFAALMAGRMFRGEATLFGRPYYTQYDPVFGPGGKVIGVLFVGVEKKYFVETRQSLMMGMVVAATLTLVILSLIGAIAFNRLFKPLGDVNKSVALLADDRLDVAIPHTTLSDDIGDLARALSVFQEHAVERRKLEQAHAEQEALRRQRAERIEGLIQAFERVTEGAIGAVSSAATQLQDAAQTMSAAAEQTSQQSLAVASASEQASANVQTAASAAEELSASVAEIGQRVNESATIAASAARDAEGAATKVSRLSEGARNIGDFVGLITSIAGQTNLLALNATIEAARAGDAGKGFAVVANEVKTLAEQTAKAAAEISAQVEQIQGATADSTQAIGAITDTIQRMDQISASIATAVEQQGAATNEIAHSVSQASAGTADVSNNIAGVAQAASNSSEASMQVLDAAGRLAAQSEELQEEVQKFLTSVRAA